jgi:hypothetical protein
VSVDGTQSSRTELIWGVAQGSVLGAILYIIYVNPLAAIALSFGIHMNQYSDDTQLRHRFPVPLQSTATDRLTACVSAILDWFLRNRVKTNVSKTELLFAWSSFRRSKPVLDPLLVGGVKVEPSISVKILGVTLDRHLNLEMHVSTVCKSAYHQIHLIGKIRKFLTLSAAKTLVISTVLSRLDFCNGILAGLPGELIKRLQRVQNAAARLVLQADRRADSSTLLHRLHWLPVRQRAHFKILTMVFRCVQGNAPLYLSSLIEPHRQPRPGLRSSGLRNLSIPIARTAHYGERAFSRLGPMLWNALPEEIKSSTTLASFRSQLKTHLFRSVVLVR